MARSLAALLVCFVALNLVSVQAQEAPALKGVKACNQALKLIEEGKPEEALKILDAAKGTMDAEDEWLWWGNRGYCYRDLRKDKEALESFSKAMELEKNCWFKFDHALLLHEFGRWDEALKSLESGIDPDYADKAEALKTVIEGPFKARWPNAFKKLELKSKVGNYYVVSDAGVKPEEMDALETQCAKLDPVKDAGKLAKLLAPHAHLQSLANLAELTRKEYMKFTGTTESQWPKGKISKVFFFANEADFKAFASRCSPRADTENMLGFYSPYLRYLQLFNMGDKPVAGGMGEETISTFWHEGWHQFFHTLAEQRPIWMDEGIAEFLNYGNLKNAGASIELGLLVRARGENYTRYERFKEMLSKNRVISLRSFLAFDDRKWNEVEDVGECYAQAWSLAYFALRGANAAFKKDYSKLFWECVKGRKWQDAAKEIFTEAKIAEYDLAWRAYWKKM